MPPSASYEGKNRLLAALPAEDFARFFSELEPVKLSLRQVLQDTVQPVECVYFVEEGVTSILTMMADGSSIEVGMVGTEGMVGVGALLDPTASSPHVIVQIPGAGLRMPVAQCKAAFDESAAVERRCCASPAPYWVSAPKPQRATGCTRSSSAVPAGC